jgi:hypothetical protein
MDENLLNKISSIITMLLYSNHSPIFEKDLVREFGETKFTSASES